MRYYDDPEAFAKRGIDYDLDACLEYNPQGTFTVLDIDRVLAMHEGENEDENWRWILRLHDGRLVFLSGGCDYTGWDCQSDANHTIVDSLAAAVACEDDLKVRAELVQQLAVDKAISWRETMDKEMLP
jgi:hypothetical protein